MSKRCEPRSESPSKMHQLVWVYTVCKVNKTCFLVACELFEMFLYLQQLYRVGTRAVLKELVGTRAVLKETYYGNRKTKNAKLFDLFSHWISMRSSSIKSPTFLYVSLFCDHLLDFYEFSQLWVCWENSCNMCNAHHISSTRISPLFYCSDSS